MSPENFTTISLEEENSEFKPAVLHLKIDFMSHFVHGKGVVLFISGLLF